SISCSSSISPLSLHDALPILDYLNVSYSWTRNIPVNKLEEAQVLSTLNGQVSNQTRLAQSTLVEDPEQEMEKMRKEDDRFNSERSEEHTSELQSRFDLVCRLL